MIIIIMVGLEERCEYSNDKRMRFVYPHCGYVTLSLTPPSIDRCVYFHQLAPLSLAMSFVPDSVPSGQFRLMVVEGIQGGFMPPKIRSAVEIEGDHQGAVVVNAKEADGDTYETKEGRLSADEATGLVKKIHGHLSALPRQPNPHSDDWYGMDVGIEFEMDGFFWTNGAPGGCSQGPREEELSATSKQQFGEFIHYIKGFAADRAQEFTTKAII
jgi:hypothetical protein